MVYRPLVTRYEAFIYDLTSAVGHDLPLTKVMQRTLERLIRSETRPC